ncbi:WXG100 family type VII secretion target [Streptomyces sp. NBC_00083]|uniref:WXG100 family type VII secretion target n=1 Tax=Streptomyces sp. NBC_00083 TaxID=2975647 RepID=UPI00225A4DB1|nr:WXG100 family type VII secretion target [Streptomyces sp. NBC_00083]MCX5386044.1 WXG100 family type VII secretion target [Streptomyces sp. NBC_00083]
MAKDQLVTDSEMIHLENEIVQKFESVKGQLKTLQGVIDSLEGAWDGIGAGAFNGKQTDINNNMVGIGKDLLDFLEAMKATRTGKGNTDHEVFQALRGVDVVEGYSGDPTATAAMSSSLSTY